MRRAGGRYGPWPFEIGVWAGKAATPNVVGRKGDGRPDSARAKVTASKPDPDRNPWPIPLASCPWCGRKLEPDLIPPSTSSPRRAGQSGAPLGGADRADVNGFYGAPDPAQGRPLTAPLQPPDFVIQDELHLISGPLGTMAGLYETATEALAVREVGGRVVKPKIVAPTATVRRVEDQTQAPFARPMNHVFPPPGPNRRHTFLAPRSTQAGPRSSGGSTPILMQTLDWRPVSTDQQTQRGNSLGGTEWDIRF